MSYVPNIHIAHENVLNAPYRLVVCENVHEIVQFEFGAEYSDHFKDVLDRVGSS
jgi:hypothetical protein